MGKPTQDRHGQVGGWLFVVSHNKALSVLTKQVREQVAVAWQPDVHDAPATDDRPDEELCRLQMAVLFELLFGLD